MKPIILASDHGGFDLKQEVKAFLEENGFKVMDVGANDAKPSEHPVFAKKGIDLVLHYDTFGIFLCGAGIGISIASNRRKGIRAALCHNEIFAQLARQHNNANVLCLPGRFMPIDEAKKVIMVFLETQFLGGHYKPRTDMYDRM